VLFDVSFNVKISIFLPFYLFNIIWLKYIHTIHSYENRCAELNLTQTQITDNF